MPSIGSTSHRNKASYGIPNLQMSKEKYIVHEDQKINLTGIRGGRKGGDEGGRKAVKDGA